MTISENANTDIRVEWVKETTEGETPGGPTWNKFSDYIDGVPGWDGSIQQAENNAVGSGDIVQITRGGEEHTITVEYWLQRFPVDGNGNIVDPVAIPFLHDYSTDYDTHTVEWRRETTEGGKAGNGYRQYVIAQGCRPFSATIPGNPDEANPQSVELEYEAEYARSYLIHQPNESTLTISSTDTNDNNSVTIESEGGTVTETKTLPTGSPNEVTTTNSFPDVDVVEVSGDHVGDIQITDGNGNDLLEKPIRGSNTNGVTSEFGLPALGSGGHASAIGNDPAQFIGLNTQSAFGGSDIADRVHQFDLSAEVDSDVNAQQGTRRPTIDEGPRTVTANVDVAGPFESTVQIDEWLQGISGDIVYTLGGIVQGSGAGDITLKEAERTDVDEQNFGASEANFIFGVTFTATDADGDGTVVTMTKT